MPHSMQLTCLSCSHLNRLSTAALNRAPSCILCGDMLMPDGVREVDLSTLERAVRRDTLPIVVDFWAPWCRPCATMQTQFASAAQAVHGRVRMVRLNTEASPATEWRFRIQGLPTMIAFHGGREAARHVGAEPSERIAAWVGAL
ncbi:MULTISPECIES: thioredoxin family protein [unclassified Meridianimarinicoccus]|uniref:thioredoxin family protein n=1 Tax=unclassified Meridianimarinicoccus TaxID=2923344 RepID=UPI001D00323E|nr:thioredoxin domain-containing protein [Fluviibacterium sp. MJW13]